MFQARDLASRCIRYICMADHNSNCLGLILRHFGHVLFTQMVDDVITAGWGPFCNLYVKFYRQNYSFKQDNRYLEK